MSGPLHLVRGVDLSPLQLPPRRPRDTLRLQLLGAALGQHLDAGDLPVTAPPPRSRPTDPLPPIQFLPRPSLMLRLRRIFNRGR